MNSQAELKTRICSNSGAVLHFYYDRRRPEGACSQPAPGQAGWTYGSIIIGSGRIGPGLILFNGPNLRLAPWPDTILNVFFFELIQMKLNVFGFEQNQRKLKPKRATLERSSDSIQKNCLNLDACGPSSNTSLPQAVDS